MYLKKLPLFKCLCRSVVVCFSFSGLQVAAQEIEQETQLKSASQSGQEPVLTVTQTRHSKDKVLNNQFITLQNVNFNPSSISELLASQPGVAQNGQPGLFQTINLRGLARQRVHIYVDGMRITSERRAGVAASFIDPTLLLGAEVTQGPASTYYGSGALGGTVHLITRESVTTWGQAGYKNDGNEWYTSFGRGGEKYAVGLAYRTRSNGETVLSDEKYNQFSQHSFTFQREFEVNDYRIDWQLIESEASDIGKDNLRFPYSRVTSYPSEKHFLTQVKIVPKSENSQQAWEARFYLHRQSLATQEIRPETSISRVKTNSLDLGAVFERTWRLENFNGLIGYDYFGRRNVDSFEQSSDFTSQQTSQFSALKNAEENDNAFFVTANRDFRDWSLHAGTRVNYISQKSEQSSQVSDHYTTYFVTAIKNIGAWDLSASYGTGFRFASLSERLFYGTTGRGQTIGNESLKPEESRGIDLGIAYKNHWFTAQAHWFDTEIEQFIERVSVDDDTKTYQNIVNGNIDGWQYQFEFFPNDVVKIQLQGTKISGKGSNNIDLADIPAQRNKLSMIYHPENYSIGLDYVFRYEKNTPGDGENNLAQANIASLKFGYHFNSDWQIQFSIDNLLNEKYFRAADDLSTLAVGRNYAVSFLYR